MVIDIVFVGVMVEFLVDSINGMVESNFSLFVEWVGLILFFIVSNFLFIVVFIEFFFLLMWNGL